MTTDAGNRQGPEKLKIAMFGHKRVPSREGGVEVVVEELGRRMANLGHQVTCYNRAGHHVSGKEFDGQKLRVYQGMRTRTVPAIRRKGLAAVSASFFAALASALGKYDVVHIHAEGPAAMCWLPKWFGKRVVVTVHGLDHQRGEKWGYFARQYILLGEKCAVRYADEIIVLSRGVQRYFAHTYGRNTTFIPNGVDRPEVLPAKVIRQKYGLQKDGYVLFLGRLVPEKGVQYLIEAYKQLDTEKKLVIAGGSSDSEGFMQGLADLAAGDPRILFTGFVQGQTLAELYSNAYVYGLPSDLEGMPLSLLEAMGYGNCCLTSDIDECAEVVGDKAVIFKKADIRDLQEKLCALLQDQTGTQRYKKQAAEYICARFRWDDAVAKTIALYQRPGQKAVGGGKTAEKPARSRGRCGAWRALRQKKQRFL